MRILIITAYFPPFNIIASHRCYSWAKYWTLAGHDVTVLTIKKEQDKSIQLNLENVGFTVIEVDYNKFFQLLRRVYRRFIYNSQTPSTSPSSSQKTTHLQQKKTISKFINHLRLIRGVFCGNRMPDITTDFWINPAFKKITKEGLWDLVISTSGPYTTHIVARRLKKKGLANKWIADFRDLWVDSHSFTGLFPFTIIEKVMEKNMMKCIDSIITVSKPLADTLHLKYPEKNIHVIENGFASEDLNQIFSKNIFPQDGKIRIAYTGSLYLGTKKQDPSLFFKAISELVKDETYSNFAKKIDIVFAGANSDVINPLIEKYQLSNQTTCYGMVSREDALRIQRDAHILLFLEWNDPSSSGIYTGKLFEYLFSRTPIISIASNKNKIASKLIEEANAGVVFCSGVEEIKTYLINSFFVNQKKKRQNVSKNVINKFERKYLAEKILRLI